MTNTTDMNLSKRMKSARGDDSELHFEKLYKMKDEYEARKKQMAQVLNEEPSFVPSTNRYKNSRIEKDVIERNQEFLAKKEEKAKKRLAQELTQCTFSPNLMTSSKSVRGLGKFNGLYNTQGQKERAEDALVDVSKPSIADKILANAAEIEQKREELRTKGGKAQGTASHSRNATGGSGVASKYASNNK